MLFGAWFEHFEDGLHFVWVYLYAFLAHNKPRNFPDLTSKVHFMRFNLNRYLCSLLNNFHKFTRCSSSVFDLAIMSST